MRDVDKTKAALLTEMTQLRQRNDVLETAAKEHRQTERLLQTSESHYRLLAENVTEVIWVRDMQLRLTYISPSVMRLRGYTGEEAMSLPLLDSLTPDTREVAQKAFADGVRLEESGEGPTDHVTTLELEAIRKDGSSVWIETRAKFLRDEAGQPVGVLGVSRDITERKRTEERLQQAHAHLEQRVQERTADLERLNTRLHSEVLERQRVEDELRQSTDHFRALVQHAPDLIAMITPEGVVRYYSPSMYHILGHHPEELIDRPIYGAMHPDDITRVQETIARVVHNPGMKQTIEYRVRHRDGSWRTLEALGSRPADDLSAACVIFNARDITDRKQAEAAFRESAARFRDLIENSIQGIVIQRHSRAVFVNQVFANMLGYATPEDILALESLQQLIAPDERDWIRRYRDDRLADLNVPAHYECQGLCQDGSLVWLQVSARVIRWEGELATEAIVTDITERKRIESALRANEKQLRAVVEGSIQGLLVLDQSGTRLFANPSYATIFGFDSPHELLGRPAKERISPHEFDRLHEIARRRFQHQEGSERYVYEGVRKDGSLIWLEAMASIIDWDNQPATLIAMMDITDRKALEDQLLQSQKMEALGTLAGGIAHEFNNMLTAILGFSKLSQSALPADSESQSYLAHVVEAGRRAKELVEQIVMFSRQGPQTQEPLVIAEVIQEAYSLTQASLPATIEMHLGGNVQHEIVLANRTQLHQVLMNLASNAEYAMRGTQGVLNVSLDAVEMAATISKPCTLSPGVYVCLSVRDSGPGMSAEVMERMFDPFFTTKGIGQGTGMGLSIVHGIVTGHGGAITVESTPTDGTTVAVYFPQVPNPSAVSVTPQEEVAAATGRVLLVDDEAMLVQAEQRLLKQLGYVVVGYTNSVEALQAFEAAPQAFDIVVTDQTMPVMTGASLVEELRRIRPDIPIILCTGFSHLMNAEKAQALGVDAFMMKPDVTEKLAPTIKKILAKRREADHG